jgi:lipopolysaccharide/colanic/teichoic acid biosynthesis glycosyltransferase
VACDVHFRRASRIAPRSSHSARQRLLRVDHDHIPSSDGEATGMQTLVSSARPAPRVEPTPRTGPAPRTSDAAVEIERAVPVIPLADVDAGTERDAEVEVYEDVVPAERDERLSRALNVTVAFVALVCLSPVLLLIALAVKLTSRGPVFYSQVRIGIDRRAGQVQAHDRRGYDQGGRPFTMYKFRTMHVNAEADGRAVWATRCDPRTTLVGCVLRRTRLDELPQLFNVLRGDMNIVGPRPERPSIFADLRVTVSQYPLRQRVKPGITGWAQINQAYDACVDDVRRKVAYDLEYVRRQSLAEDVRIMAMTLPVMLFRKGGW